MTEPTRTASALPPRARDVLDQQLGKNGMTFSQWMILLALHGPAPFTRRELIRLHLDAHGVADAAVVATAIDELLGQGLIAASGEGDGDQPLACTTAGEEAFRPLRDKVSSIAQELYGDLV